MNLVLAAFLAAHALIHISFLTPAPPVTAGGPEWPFQTSHSWLVTRFGLDPGIAHGLATVLVATTIGLLLAAAGSTVGWLPATWWPSLVVLGAVSSLATLVVFFHPWLVLGVVIDLVLLWATLAAGWTPSSLDA
jgi:hypothetical protein